LKLNSNQNTLNNMKKISIILALGGMIATSYGQGFVNFANNAATDVSTNASTSIFGGSSGYANATTGLTTGSAAAPGGYYFALLMQAYTSPAATNDPTVVNLLSSGWSFTGAFATNALGLGRLGGGATAPTTANDTVGNGNQFVIIGWSANLAGGNGWSTISNDLATQTFTLLSGTEGFFGISGVGVGTGQANTSPEAMFSGTGVSGPMTLFAVPTPEPATIALAGLGGLSMLLFRRRKS
jgi:PEP-CTERM motif